MTSPVYMIFAHWNFWRGRKIRSVGKRWGERLDRMKNRAKLLCGNSRKKNRSALARMAEPKRKKIIIPIIRSMPE